MKASTHRILSTHVGSLPRPKPLLDQMRNTLDGRGDELDYADALREAVVDCVRQQVAHGIDVVTDGEQSKTGFSRYISERLEGFEMRPRPAGAGFAPEVADFPEYYEQYFRRAMYGGAVAQATALECVGPVAYVGQAQIARDVANLKEATRGSEVDEVFMPAVAPSAVGRNTYYESDEEYYFAVADALHVEYQAIVDARFVLQVDDPFLSELFSYSELPRDECRERADLYVAALNRALSGIPPDKVRYHTCYGINEGPRTHDAPLSELLPLILKINAGAYSFEAANARHEHEYHVWERAKLPADKLLIPGVVTHSCAIVEHPELVAERITRFARIVGRERVLAGADCGFSSQATYNPEIHPRIVWAKFEALAEGARLASQTLWA
ncbi:MAG: cobalamin-independent methionine synthase II family protein [Chloroflexi bacterium]|nr:cobalamin-independent methionine synthase II family protein [Chloroflexota bacterium]MBV9595749.1 cobalamin-independent methionine synthase II family protein [Chloroflexota bacterium]